MKYKCSLNNNYEIIGLCDLKKFNKKISEFKDRSWSQINLSKITNIPNKKMRIKSINKVFVGIKIISTKIVPTPVAKEINMEGFNLNGNILLVFGEVHYNIMYISDTQHNSISSIKSINQFHTYIVLDKNSNIENDEYAIYPFIEDVSVRKLNNERINKTISLFLFAHKIKGEVIPPEPPKPTIEKLQNKIIIKSNNNSEVLSIEFAKEIQTFIISSTGIIPNPSSSEVYLTFILKNKIGDTILKATLNSNETGENFKSIINNKTFKYGESILTLIYKDKNKIEISNFPNQGLEYIPNVDFNIFSIESTGLKNIALNNKIKIINDLNEEISSIYFVKPTTDLILFFKMIATSTSLISTDNLKEKERYVEYLQYTLNKPLLQTEILAKETTNNFAKSLDGKNIRIANDILRLSSRLPNKIIITNYNNQNEYVINEEPEFLSIAEDGIVPHLLDYDKIRLKNKDNSTILFIYFDEIIPSSLYIEPYSTGILNKDCDLFSFKILNPTETITKIQGKINKNQTGDAINVNPIFNISKNLSIGDTLEITCSNPSLVEIYKFPFTSSPYNLRGVSQKFKITIDGLVSFEQPLPLEILPNSFIIYASDVSKELARIEFDKQNLKLIISSTGNLYNGPIVFTAFEFQLRKSDGLEIKDFSTISSNDNADNFKSDLNNEPFEYGDLIYLGFFDFSKIVLTNYPNKGDTYKMKSFNSQGFKITENGIIPYLLQNEIILNDTSNQPVINLQFDILTKKIIVTITGRKTNPIGSDNYLVMTLYANDGTTERRSSFVTGNDTGVVFRNAFNNINFQFGYILELEYEENNKVVITNFPPKTSLNYNPTGNQQYFEITKDGLILASLAKTLIELKGFANKLIATINFDVVEKRLLISSTFYIAYDEFGSEEYFSLTLKDSNENIKAESAVRGYGTAMPFKEKLNDTPFEYGDILLLRYKINNNVLIFNYPNLGRIYNPFFGEESFKITQDGLKLAYNFLDNLIILKNISDNILLIVKFNTTLKTLFVVSSDYVASVIVGSKEYFALVLKNFDGKVKIQSSIKGNENAKNFRDRLNNVSFEYGDIITLRYNENYKVLITNYPNKGQSSNPLNNSESFQITQGGIKAIII